MAATAWQSGRAWQTEKRLPSLDALCGSLAARSPMGALSGILAGGHRGSWLVLRSSGCFPAELRASAVKLSVATSSGQSATFHVGQIDRAA